MESDLGKLFIGGISWDTNEDHLREYFSIFGEIVEAVIMKDRTTGRARGFGFVVFADPAVAERVVMEKHLINGRMVEAKKAIPRDDKHILLNKNSNSLQASPGLGRTKKIFVGGLASTVTNTDFKVYFEQFGDITDVVVMYDHNTQRPRGFGFITFDSEDAVDKVLLKTFHELNGKLVEVKRAVPKELSPGPTRRLPTGGHNYGFNRVNSFLNGCSQEYNSGSIVSHGMSMDSRFGPLTGGQKGFSSLGPGHGIGLNFEHGLSHNYGESLNLNDSIGHGQAISSYYSGNSSRLGSLIGYGTGSGISGTAVSSAGHTLWDNGGLTYNSNPASANPFTASGIGSIARFGNGNSNWRGSSSPLATHSLGNDSGFTTGNLSYGIGDNTFDLFSNNYGRNNHNGSLKSTFTATRHGYEGNYASSCGSNSIYGDPTWQLASNKLDGSSPLGYGFGATSADVVAKGSIDYISGFNATDRHINREG